MQGQKLYALGRINMVLWPRLHYHHIPLIQNKYSVKKLYALGSVKAQQAIIQLLNGILLKFKYQKLIIHNF